MNRQWLLRQRIGLVMVLLLLVGCGGSPEGTPGPSPELAGPYSGKDGDTAEGGGYFLTVMAVEDPARPEWDPWYYPERGTKLVAVEIVVGCVSCEGVSVHPLLAVLVDADGGAYMAELGALERHRQLVPITIGPGEYARGRVAFEIPDSAVKAKVKYMFPDVTLQVGLVE